MPACPTPTRGDPQGSTRRVGKELALVAGLGLWRVSPSSWGCLASSIATLTAAIAARIASETLCDSASTAASLSTAPPAVARGNAVPGGCAATWRCAATWGCAATGGCAAPGGPIGHVGACLGGAPRTATLPAEVGLETAMLTAEALPAEVGLDRGGDRGEKAAGECGGGGGGRGDAPLSAPPRERHDSCMSAPCAAPRSTATLAAVPPAGA